MSLDRQILFFFFSSRRRHTRFKCDWSSDVCSSDLAGDGKVATHPDVISVDRAESGDRLWYRVTFREPLPRSFGTNIVVNRSGDPAAGMAWWGTGSTFRFDRLVTAWISRHGDRYFGR